MKYSKEQSAKRGKRYVCRICKDRYHMTSEEYKKRSLTFRKRTCDKDDCLDIAAAEVAKKAIKKVRKEEKERLRKAIGIKGKQSQDPLQKVMNKIARLLDKDEPCLARPFENQNIPLQGGHIYSVGSHPALRYNIWNIHGQSHKSNAINGGEPHLMIEGIERRYGIEQRRKVENLVKEYKVLKLSREEKKAALKVARRLMRELEKGTIFTRDEINKQIGIYK